MATGAGLFGDKGGELSIRLGGESHLVGPVSDETVRNPVIGYPEGSRVEWFKAPIVEADEEASAARARPGDLDAERPIRRVLHIDIPPVATDHHQVAPVFILAQVG
jgi:hypothetical protein